MFQTSLFIQCNSFGLQQTRKHNSITCNSNNIIIIYFRSNKLNHGYNKWQVSIFQEYFLPRLPLSIIFTNIACLWKMQLPVSPLDTSSQYTRPYGTCFRIIFGNSDNVTTFITLLGYKSTSNGKKTTLIYISFFNKKYFNYLIQ